MNNTDVIALFLNGVLGTLVPIIANWLQERSWSREAKMATIYAVSAIFASPIAWVLSDGSITDWVAFSIQIMGIATIVYNVFMRKMLSVQELKNEASPLRPVINRVLQVKEGETKEPHPKQDEKS